MNKDENLNTTVLKHHVQLYLLWDEAGCPRLWNKHVPDTTGQLAAAPGKGNPAPWQSQAAPKWKIHFLVSFQSGQHRKTQYSPDQRKSWPAFSLQSSQNFPNDSPKAMIQPSSQAGQPAQGFFQLFRLRCPARLGLIDALKTFKMQSGQLFQQLLTVAIERRLEIHSPLASHSHVKPIGDLFSAKFLDHTSLLSFAPPSPFPAHSQAFETSDHDISAQDQKDQNLILLFQINKKPSSILKSQGIRCFKFQVDL